MSITNIILIGIILLLTAYCIRQKLRQPAGSEGIPRQERPDLQISNNDIMQYIKQTADSFKPLMESKEIAFSVKCTPESMMGWMDADKMDKIILLLLSDMLKNAPEEGKITLDAHTNASYDQLTIRISDNGPKGTKLGYAIVRYLVSIYCGSIRSEYYEGQGNTIVMELPIKKDGFPTEKMATGQPSTFHIPTNIELNVPTIALPEGYEEGGKGLGAIVQQAYVSADQEYVQRAIRCVQEHIMDSDYDREAFAADMGSSVSTLYNKIRALTGKSITNFVRDIRIKQACRLAKEQPDLRVSDIAYQVGFKDPKYFATSFKRVTGLQPKEYINQQKSASR